MSPKRVEAQRGGTERAVPARLPINGIWSSNLGKACQWVLKEFFTRRVDRLIRNPVRKRLTYENFTDD